MTTKSAENGEARIAVVTGGAAGIGFAIAQRLIADGLTVVVLDIADNLDVAVKELGDAAHGMHCDITSSRELRRAATEIAACVGHVGVLVNSAGFSERGAFLDVTPGLQHKILDVNLIATLDVTRQFLPSIIAAPEGRIVMLSSDAARVGIPQGSIFAAAKAGVVAFAKSLAVEVSKTDTTVNAISPSTIDTPSLRALLNTEQLEHRVRQNPMRRFGTAEEVAALASYLIGPESSYVSGQVISINGALVRVD